MASTGEEYFAPRKTGRQVTTWKPVPFEEALNLTGYGRYNYGLMAVCSLLLLAMGMDMFGPGIIVPAAACDFDINMQQRAILSGITFIGMILTSHAWGYLSDMMGRRRVLVWTMWGGFLMAFLSGFAPHWIVMTVLKFLSSAFTSAANASVYTFLGEFIPLRYRNSALLLMTTSLMMSQVVPAVLAIPILPMTFEIPIDFLGITYRPWRLLTHLCSAVCGISAFWLSWFPESPKYLACQGQLDDALEVLRNMYSKNTGDDPDNYPVKNLHFDDGVKQEKTSLMRSIWIQTIPLFKKPLLRNNSILFYILIAVYGAGNAFFMWYPTIVNVLLNSAEKGQIDGKNLCESISFIKADTESNTTKILKIKEVCDDTILSTTLYTIIALGAYLTITNLILSVLVRWTGKKIAIIFVLFISACGGVLCNFIYQPIIGLGLTFVFETAALALGLLSTYVVDLNPTNIRGMGVCLAVLTGRLSGFLSVNLVGYLLEKNECELAFNMYGALLFTAVVAALFLPTDAAIQKKNGAEPVTPNGNS